MALNFVPPASGLTDEQYLQIAGPNGLLTGFQYDSQQRTLYFKESQVIYPSFHGPTHIAQDPVPEATADTRGLMSAADKVKLDTLIGTRLGVLRFMGAGFPDDGGWMQGDIILAAGTEFISLERVGNIIRFTVDSPVPLNCSQEACAQIYWAQDETDVSAIRPPACGGKMPGLNGYGEFKIFVLPESTIVDPNNPSAKLNLKGNYPSLTFTRYTSGIAPNVAEFECVLQRDAYNTLQTQVGWVMTPGVSQVPEMVWFMGKDTDGNQIRFDLDADTTPGLLGGLLYNGNLITRRMGVVTAYTGNVLITNQYMCRWWDVERHKPIGSVFTATNVWQYNYPENVQVNRNPQSLVTDGTVDLLSIGTLVDIIFFKVGDVAGTPINHYYFSKQPALLPTNLWADAGGVQFGDMVWSRIEVSPEQVNELTASTAASSVLDSRCFRDGAWGLTGVDDPVIQFTDFRVHGLSATRLNMEPRASIDAALPGLVVRSVDTVDSTFYERPVYLWNRQEVYNALIRVELGRPAMVQPLDVLLGAPIDGYGDVFMQMIEPPNVFQAQNQGKYYIRVKGVRFQDLPTQGTVRCVMPGSPVATSSPYNAVFNYGSKLLYNVWGDSDGLDSVILVADDNNEMYTGSQFDILQLVHQEYNAPCVRVEFIPSNDTLHSIAVQVKVGQLDMGTAYEGPTADMGGGYTGVGNITEPHAEYVRGMAPGFTVSQLYQQSASFTGVGVAPMSVPAGFMIVDGGVQGGGSQPEYWNYLDVMLRDNEVWVWWNNLLIPPSAVLSGSLPSPVGVNTPYFPITRSRRYGKVGLRMWPGTKLRSVSARTQLRAFSEFSYGQLTVGASG